MATTSISDAVVVPQDLGTGLPSRTDPNSAAIVSLIGSNNGDEYVEGGLTFTNHDSGNGAVDVTAGCCYVLDTSSSTSNSRGSGGNAKVQSSTTSSYDTEIPVDQLYTIIVPTDITVSCTSGSTNEIWVNVTDITSNNSAEIRSSGGGGTTAQPSDTYLKIGEVDPGDATQDTYFNRAPARPFVYSPGHTEWTDGLSNEEVARFVGVSGESYHIEEVQFLQKGGGSSTSASVDIYDVGASSQLMSADLGSRTTGSASSVAGNTVIVRVTNSTGSVVNGSIFVDGYRG